MSTVTSSPLKIKIELINKRFLYYYLVVDNVENFCILLNLSELYFRKSTSELLIKLISLGYQISSTNKIIDC